MKWLPLLLLCVLTACSDPDSIDDRIARLSDTDVTTGGVRIRTELPISYSTKQAVERGISTALIKGMCFGYLPTLYLSDFRVVFLKGELAEDGYPYLVLPAGEYTGTAFDKGGFIHAAGEYHSDRDVLVIPLAGVVTESYLEEIAEHEATHRIYFIRDRPRFEATRVHREGEVFLMEKCK